MERLHVSKVCADHRTPSSAGSSSFFAQVKKSAREIIIRFIFNNKSNRQQSEEEREAKERALSLGLPAGTISEILHDIHQRNDKQRQEKELLFDTIQSASSPAPTVECHHKVGQNQISLSQNAYLILQFFPFVCFLKQKR